jgi:septal ring factor EnvC (AmiA/AmiB activator)
LKKRSDQVNTQLGDVAQQQDKCMVHAPAASGKSRSRPVETRWAAAAEKLQKTISELKTRQEAYDQDVARLMEEDESIDREIMATEKSITESATTIQALNARLETHQRSPEIEYRRGHGQSRGKSFSGTKITGPHSSLGPSRRPQAAFRCRNGQTGSFRRENAGDLS